MAVACAALIATTAAAAPVAASEPQTLWDAYPLGQTVARDGGAGQAGGSPAQTHRRVRAKESTSSNARSEGNLALSLVLGAVAALFLLATFAMRALPRDRSLAVASGAVAAAAVVRAATRSASHLCTALRVRGRMAVIVRAPTPVDSTPRRRRHARRAGPPAPASGRAAAARARAAAGGPAPAIRDPTPPPPRDARMPTALPSRPVPLSRPSSLRTPGAARPDRAEAPPDAAPSCDPTPARPAKDHDLSRHEVPYRDGSAGGAPLGSRERRDPAPAVSAAHGADGGRSMADGAPAVARVQRCAIRYARLGGRARFHVVTVEDDGTTCMVAGSREFRVARTHKGDVRDAFAELLGRLQAAGWVRVETGGAWHDAEFVRACDVEYERAIVSCWRGLRRAQFLAFLLDDFGTPSGYAESPFFRLRDSERVEPSGSSQEAHDRLLWGLGSEGWQVTGTAGQWYATTLRRRLQHRPVP